MNAVDFPKIRNIVNEFFQRTGLPIEVEVKEPNNSIIPVNLKTEDAQILIGERGQTLFEMQGLVKLILRKQLKTQEQFFVDMDINGYKKKKEEYLREMSRLAADEVVLTKNEKELTPMSAYERRIIHLALTERNDVVSESIGEGSQRHVVIRRV